jgi:hypothetical protein
MNFTSASGSGPECIVEVDEIHVFPQIVLVLGALCLLQLTSASRSLPSFRRRSSYQLDCLKLCHAECSVWRGSSIKHCAGRCFEAGIENITPQFCFVSGPDKRTGDDQEADQWLEYLLRKSTQEADVWIERTQCEPHVWFFAVEKITSCLWPVYLCSFYYTFEFSPVVWRVHKVWFRYSGSVRVNYHCSSQRILWYDEHAC